MAIIGLDLGASKLSAKIIFANGCFEDKISLPRMEDFYKESNIIKKFLTGLLQKLNKERLVKCACSSAATIDEVGTIIRWPNRSYWDGENLGEIFKEVLNVDVFFKDDGNAAAFAEAKIHGLNNLIYIGIGSGIGGGIILNNQLVEGDSGKSAEFGHIIVEPDGEICSCGRNGCLQVYSSGHAILKNTYKDDWVDKTKNDLFNDLSKYKISAIVAVDIAAKMLARALVNINEIMDISAVVIGGGIGSNFKELYENLDCYLQKLARKGQSRLQIASAKFGERSSLEGAVYLTAL